MSIEALNWARQVGRAGALRPGEILVLWQLADSADQRDWSCWPSQDTIALETNQSLRTVSSQIGTLKKLGLVSVEDRRGSGGGRIGKRYYLLREAGDDLGQTSRDASSATAENRENTRHANSAFGSENPGNERHANIASRSTERHANIAFGTENGSTERHANSAFGQPKRNLTSNPNANSRFGHYKERARINPHLKSSSSVGEDADESDRGSGQIDEDDDRLIHRGVDLDLLCEQIPVESDAEAVSGALMMRVVDVVLDRASTRVSRPGRYVARAVQADPVGVLAEARERLPATVAGRDGDGSGAASHPGDQDRWGAGSGTPCTNPDHWAGDVNLGNCGPCRVEAKLGDPVPHFEQLSDEDLSRWPREVRDHVERLRAEQPVSS